MPNRRRWKRFALVACAAAVLCLAGLGRPALWEPDEGRYAEIAREMLVGKDYTTPRDDGVRYFEKPPLMYWLTAVSVRALGPSEFAARLPAALFSVGQMLLTAALAETMFGPEAALPAALCLGLSPLFFGFSRFLTLDPALAFFVCAGLAAFYIGARQERPDSGRARMWFLAASASAAMGTLAKGPVALLLVAGVAAVFTLADGQGWRNLRIPWLSCALVYGAIALPWFIVVARHNPGFAHFFFVHEHVQRYLLSTEHAWGVWFLPLVALGGAWPWVCFVPFALSDLRSDRGARQRSARNFLVTWFCCVLVFFSAARSKLGSYVLPALPPLAIVAGYGMVCARGRLSAAARRTARALTALNVVVSLGALTAAIALGLCAIGEIQALSEIQALRWLAQRMQPLAAHGKLGALAAALCANPVLARFGRDIAASVVLLATAGALGIIAARADGQRAMMVGAVGGIAAMVLLIRARDDARSLGSYRGLARAIQAPLHSGCALVSYRHFVQSLPFYTGAREVLVGYRGELAPFSRGADAKATFIDDDAGLLTLWRSPRCVVLIADRQYLPALAKLLSPAPRALAAEGQKVALCNRDVLASGLKPQRGDTGLLPRD
jgi:4-amino-4-deoxy-L-arabinose transferase-like glycosyltransferase